MLAAVCYFFAQMIGGLAGAACVLVSLTVGIFMAELAWVLISADTA